MVVEVYKPTLAILVIETIKFLLLSVINNFAIAWCYGWLYDFVQNGVMVKGQDHVQTKRSNRGGSKGPGGPPPCEKSGPLVHVPNGSE